MTSNYLGAIREEYFGIHEKAWDKQQWFEIAKMMKSSPYTHQKYHRDLAEAEHQSSRFENIGRALGGISFLGFLKFPVIRYQPTVARICISAAIAYLIYYRCHSMAEQLNLTRIKFTYRTQVVDKGGHNRVII